MYLPSSLGGAETEAEAADFPYILACLNVLLHY